MIRDATAADYDRLAEMVLEFYSGVQPSGLVCDELSLRIFFKQAPKILVYESGGKIVGVIAGMVSPWMFNRGIIVMNELGWFVPSEYRAKYPMAAHRLLQALRGWGKDMGATVMVLSSIARVESPRVKRFYEKMGLALMDSNYIGGI